jgi:hypothetical protein
LGILTEADDGESDTDFLFIGKVGCSNALASFCDR